MKALIIDDERDIRELIALSLQSLSIQCDLAEDVQQALNLLDHNTYQLCFTDLNLPDGSGMDIVHTIEHNYPNLPVAVITAYGDMNTAVQAMKAGAFDFIAKPIDLKILRQTAENALQQSSKSHADTTQKPQDQVDLLGDSQPMQQLKTQILKVARSMAPVHIHGESGTGKELVAQLIHQHSPRSEKPFIPINCGALPAELIESELFGHKKGSFSGAFQDNPGLFKQAHGGTLFLDEIAELPLLMQVKLLRALQEKKIRPVGSATEEAIDVRIISASHKNLQDCVQQGSFRQDLFYRINVIELDVPPLRKRTTDIEPLIKHFINKIASDMQIEAPNLSKQALDELLHYPFPGNVRELENILQRAITLCENNTIQSNDLGLVAIEKPKATNLTQIQHNIEADLIKQALEKNHWNKKAAAEELGISYRQLRYKVDKLGIG